MGAPLIAEAQQVPRVGMVTNTAPVQALRDPERRGPVLRAFVQRLGELGWVEGKSIAREWRSAEGREERLPDIMSELVRLKVGAIVTGDTRMAQIAKQTTSAVPIVMGASDEPVEAGLVTNLRHPGGNLTGFTLVVGPQVAGKHLELLKELAPGISRVAVISESPSTASSLAWRRETEASARRLGLMPFWITVDRREDLAKISAAITGGRADALVAHGTTTNFSYRDQLIAIAAAARPRAPPPRGCQRCTGIRRPRGRAGSWPTARPSPTTPAVPPTTSTGSSGVPGPVICPSSSRSGSC